MLSNVGVNLAKPGVMVKMGVKKWELEVQVQMQVEEDSKMKLLRNGTHGTYLEIYL
jgi:hypothetical protein